MPRRHDREEEAQSREHPGPLQDLEAKKKKKKKGGKNQSLAEGVWRWTCRSVGHAMPNEKLKAAYTSSSLRPHALVA